MSLAVIIIKLTELTLQGRLSLPFSSWRNLAYSMEVVLWYLRPEDAGLFLHLYPCVVIILCVVMVLHAGPLDFLLSAVQVGAESAAVFRQCSVVEERPHGCPAKESRPLAPWCVYLRSHLGDLWWQAIRCLLTCDREKAPITLMFPFLSKVVF